MYSIVIGCKAQIVDVLTRVGSLYHPVILAQIRTVYNNAIEFLPTLIDARSSRTLIFLILILRLLC